MKTVTISELKAKLSSYLRWVRRGGEIQVLDRGVPVARITRLSATKQGEPAARKRLISSGLLRAGSGEFSGILNTPPVRVSIELSRALAEEREDRL